MEVCVRNDKYEINNNQRTYHQQNREKEKNYSTNNVLILIAAIIHRHVLLHENSYELSMEFKYTNKFINQWIKNKMLTDLDSTKDQMHHTVWKLRNFHGISQKYDPLILQPSSNTLFEWWWWWNRFLLWSMPNHITSY